MSRSTYEAGPSDGREILRILESSAAKGRIELTYTRRPDAYESYMKEAGEARVFVSRDGARTVGTCAEIIREVYVGGEVRKAAYVCGLKKDADYEGGVGLGARFLRDLCREDIDLYYCSVVADNLEAQRMFEKTRRIISMQPVAGYKTYILSPRVRIKTPGHSLSFRRATKEDLPALLSFLHTEGRKKDLFPAVRTLDEFYGLHTEDFYLLLDGGGIVATAALWNQTAYKQYVVKKYRGVMRLARGVSPLLCALGYIRLPREDEPLNFPMLSFFLSQNDREDYYRILLDEIRREASKAYGMLVIGLSRTHVAAPLLDALPSICFETKLYEIRLPWARPKDGQVPCTLDPERIHPECGLL